jgi:hypothetical protein
MSFPSLTSVFHKFARLRTFPFMGRCFCLILLVLTPGLAFGQTLREARAIPAPRPDPQPAPAVATLPPAEGSTIPISESLQHYITRLVLDEVPREYENTKKWGKTRRVMTGLDWEQDGLKIETRRRWKDVNHGTWSRYKLRLIDPDNTFEVRLENLRDLGDNTAGFDLIGVAKLACTGRISQWKRGVQLISLSGDADAKVRLVASVELKMAVDPKTFPPDILLAPRVTSADLQLQQFELQRLGLANGPVVEQLGELVEEGLQDYLAENRVKLAEKMNKQLDKKREKLRIPLSKLTTSKWGKWFGDFFGQERAAETR